MLELSLWVLLSHHSTVIVMKKCSAYGVTTHTGMEDTYEYPQWIDNQDMHLVYNNYFLKVAGAVALTAVQTAVP